MPLWLQSALLAISFALAALLGFAAHRANICTVKVVEEVLSTRRAFMLLSFVKMILWIMMATLLLLWILPGTRANLTGWQFSLYSLAGGAIFGMGAVINGGCAFSTLTRLGDGEVSMLLALMGFALGVFGHVLLIEQAHLPPALPGEGFLGDGGAWVRVLLAGLVVWGLWELWRLWRSRPAGVGLAALLQTRDYRLSAAALLIGISNAVLFALHGEWVYISVLARQIGHVTGVSGQGDLIPWLLLLCLIAGVFASARQRGSFHLQLRPRRDWLWHLAGGILMGFGAALVPGGNMVLLLHGLPTLSAHAVPAFIAMLAGIAVTLGLMRLSGGAIARIDCSGDICRQ